MSARHYQSFIQYLETHSDINNVIAFLEDNPFPREILTSLDDKYNVQFCQSDDDDLDHYGCDIVGYLFRKAWELGPRPTPSRVDETTKATLIDFYYGSEGGEFGIYVLVYR